MEILGVAIAGSLGAVSRYLVANWIGTKHDSSFPWGTFFINITGSFLLGFVATVSFFLFSTSEVYRTIISVGFIGAYTTFSTFSFESFNLISEGSYLQAFLNLIISPTLGIIAAVIGIELAKTI